MMRWITGSSVRLAKLVVALAIAFVAFGVAQLRTAPLDTYPEFLPPMVQIRTEALGLSPAEVEQLITVPLEQDLLNGVPWLAQIRSESMPGLSSVDLIFEPGTNILHARQMVQERLAQVAGLPNVGSRPTMIQPLSSTSRVMMIGLSSKTVSPIDLSVLARWKIRPRLMGISGVSNVAIWGQRDRQLQVQVDPRRLAAHGVTLNQVIDSTGNAMWSSPLTFVEASTPGTGGFIDTANQRFGVQHMMPITTPRQLASVTIEGTSGRRLRLSSVAHVVQDHQPLIGDARTDRGPSLLLVIQKFPDADTVQVTKDLDHAMAALGPGLSGIRVDTTVYRPAGFIESSIHNIGLAGMVSLLLVILALGLVTFSWRVLLTAFLAIPVSVVAAAYVLFLRGTTVNSFTVAGLAVALAVVVDDAVADTHSIWRRLQERRTAPGDGAATDEQVLAGSHDVRRPLLYATIILVLVAVPLAVVGGVAGAFTREFAVSFAVAVIVSMAVALTVTPAAAFLLMRGQPPRERLSPVVGLVNRVFNRAAPRFLDSRRWAYGSVAVLALAGLAAIPQLGSGSLLPSPGAGDVLVELRTAPGTSLTEMDRVTTVAGRELRAVPGVRGVGVHVGRAVTSDQVVDVNSAELWLNIAPSADHAATLDRIRHVLSGFPGLNEKVTSYGEQQLADARTGNGHPLTVRVFGQDLPTLQAQAARVRNAIGAIDGVAKPQVEGVVEEPTVQVRVNLAAAERHGIRPGDVRRTAATLLSGLLVGNLYEEQKVFDVVVWGTPAVRQNLDTVKHLMIDTPSGGQVPLQDVATVRMGPAPSVIRHEDVSRYLDVTADVRGRSVDSVVRDVRARIQGLRYPYEYHAEVVDRAVAAHGLDGRVVGLGLACLVLVFLLLQAMSGSWRTATLLVVLLPLAVVGGVLVAPLAGGLMTAGALMGLLAVLAVAARNAAVLVQRFQQGAARATGRATILSGAHDVLAPVVTTAVTLAAAMIPFVVSGARAGEEILHPLAVVVLGGLVTSTLLTLFVIPALYLRFAVSARPGPSEARLPRQRTGPAGEQRPPDVQEVGHGTP